MRMNGVDREWVLTCFGTAVGAGILFLPIQAGLGGIWPTLVLTLVIFPVTYVAHRGITRIVASCDGETDIIGAVEQDLGYGAGFVVSVLYFLSIITICVGYATGITNTVNSFLTHQLGMEEVSRPLLAFILLAIMTAVLLGNKELMIKVTSGLTYPLIILLAVLSVYMMPKWNLSIFYRPFGVGDFFHNLFLLLPVLVFAMNFSPVCSSVGSFYRKHSPGPREAVARSDMVVKWTALILLVFVMFFVLSLLLSTTPEMLQDAHDKNIDVLTALSLAFEQPILVWIPPIISFLAIASSYFGHFTGTREGLTGIITRLATWGHPEKRAGLNYGRLNVIITISLLILLWLLAVYNPSILTIIGALSAPIIAMYAYLMPVLLMKRVPRLRIYQSPWGALVFVVGLAGIIGDLLSSYVF